MERDVQWLIDWTSIRELTARYNRCFDDGDIDGFTATFTPDGVMEVVGGFEAKGTEQLARMCASTPYGVVHVTTDATIDIDGDRAVQDVTVLVCQRPPKDASAEQRRSTIERSGRYRDELVRTGEGWRFARRTVVLDGGI